MRELTPKESKQAKTDVEARIAALNKLQQGYPDAIKLFFTDKPRITGKKSLGVALQGPIKIAQNDMLPLIVYRMPNYGPFPEVVSKNHLYAAAGKALKMVLAPTAEGFDPYKAFRERYEEEKETVFFDMVNVHVRIFRHFIALSGY